MSEMTRISLKQAGYSKPQLATTNHQVHEPVALLRTPSNFAATSCLGYTSTFAIDQFFHTPPKTVVINTSILIPGDGEPVGNTSLVIIGKIIEWVGPTNATSATYFHSQTKVHTVPILMPGLWDCHTHFMGSTPPVAGVHMLDMIATHPATAGAQMARGCWEALQRGYTSLRDTGGYGCEIAQAITDGSIIGPTIYSAGACLSQTGGHGDIFALPVGEIYGEFGVASPRAGNFGTGVICVADGVEECRRAVRLQIRRGARVIKVFASGGVSSRDDDPANAQYSKEELRVIVEEAEQQQRIVTAHVHGKAGILAAIEAGCKSPEHVSYADEECCKLMKEKHVLYVATRDVVESTLAQNGRNLPPESWEKMKKLAGAHWEAYQRAVRMNLKIAFGTDRKPGENFAREIELAVRAGMTPIEAIKAATANGPLSVGRMAAKSGQLKVGYEADVLALSVNPLRDVTVLQDKQNITHVWKGGKLMKGPGVGPWGEES